MRRAVGNRLGSDVLTTRRVEVASEAKVEIQKVLTAYQTGVRLVTVELQDVTPPDMANPPSTRSTNRARTRNGRSMSLRNRQTEKYPRLVELRANVSVRLRIRLERVNRAKVKPAVLQQYWLNIRVRLRERAHVSTWR